jgi:alkanesulfonate monooxygenase SsuD/methylene tetrahydromethanopterin reductase-like flavin-dependent oxidoreductase (luciferase family)
MEIGIGLPNAVPGVDGESIAEFARRADQREFSSLGTIDRIVYANYEPLIALGAAAAVTERIGLATTILITPYRPNAALLAKQALTLDHLSGGRFTMGVGIGAREDDYTASDISMKGRGAALERQLEKIRQVWDGEEFGFAGSVGPPPVGRRGPQLLVGGSVEAAFDRAARYGDGWIAGAVAPDMFAEASAKVDAAWERAGRNDKPRKPALAYYALGPNAAEDIRSSVKDYYAWLGPYADQIADASATSPDEVSRYVQAFEQAGCTELIFFPGSPDAAQVDLLADAAGLG